MHMFVTGHGPRAVVKPAESNDFIPMDLVGVKHGLAKPETPVKA